MPITSFSSVADKVSPAQKGNGHFIVSVDFNDEKLWVPYADGVWFQPCSFNTSSGSFSLVLKALPGASLGIHYHVGCVHGYTLSGHWGYKEYDWTATPGTFIFEPPGEAHTLLIRDDSPETALIFFMVDGGLIYLDKPVDGGFAAFEDSFSALQFCRSYYSEAGLDIDRLDRIVR